MRFVGIQSQFWGSKPRKIHLSRPSGSRSRKIARPSILQRQASGRFFLECGRGSGRGLRSGNGSDRENESGSGNVSVFWAYRASESDNHHANSRESFPKSDRGIDRAILRGTLSSTRRRRVLLWRVRGRRNSSGTRQVCLKTSSDGNASSLRVH